MDDVIHSLHEQRLERLRNKKQGKIWGLAYIYHVTDTHFGWCFIQWLACHVKNMIIIPKVRESNKWESYINISGKIRQEGGLTILYY